MSTATLAKPTRKPTPKPTPKPIAGTTVDLDRMPPAFHQFAFPVEDQGSPESFEMGFIGIYSEHSHEEAWPLVVEFIQALRTMKIVGIDVPEEEYYTDVD